MSYIPSSSGTYSYKPAISDLALDAFERCGIRDAALTQSQLASCRRSLNLVLSSWANLGINLWKVDLVSVLMSQGVGQYAVDPSVVNVQDTVLRTYQMGSPGDVTPAFTTVSGSATVIVEQPGSAAAAGAFIAIMIPVSVGGVVLYGFYQVQSVTSGSTYTITAASAATASVTAGGAVPVFTTTPLSELVSVVLDNHGLLAGQPFQVQAFTQIGGITLQGGYTVASVIDANTFTITAPFAAGFAQTVAENGGQTQIAQQAIIQGFTQNADPTDILLYPLSRNDWAAIPDKQLQGRPTSYWFDRTLNGTMNIWPVPDGNGPYQLNYYVSRYIEDADFTMGQVLDLPQSFYEAFTSALAAHLAMKWAPERAQLLTTYAQQKWIEAADENREKVPTYVAGDLSGYYR